MWRSLLTSPSSCGALSSGSVLHFWSIREQEDRTMGAIVLMVPTLLPVPGLGRCSTNTEMGNCSKYGHPPRSRVKGSESPHRHCA